MWQIKDNTTSGQWYCIPSKEDPAGGPSRGFNAVKVNSNDHLFPELSFMWQDKFWSSKYGNKEPSNDDQELKIILTYCTLLSDDIVVSV